MEGGKRERERKRREKRDRRRRKGRGLGGGEGKEICGNRMGERRGSTHMSKEQEVLLVPTLEGQTHSPSKPH